MMEVNKEEIEILEKPYTKESRCWNSGDNLIFVLAHRKNKYAIVTCNYYIAYV